MVDTSHIRIHSFRSTTDAYNKSQTGYYEYPEGEQAYIEVDDGDIMIIESEKVIGIMVDAWPTAFTKAHGELHHPTTDGFANLKERYQGWTWDTLQKEIDRHGYERFTV